MEKIRLLLYCTKQLHKLFNTDKGFVLSDFELGDAYKDKTLLNGKIVAECDFEVEKIIPVNVEVDDYDYGLFSGKDLLKESCLSDNDIYEYLQDDDGEIFNKGYAIHIKNLKERVMELSDCYKYTQDNFLNGGKYLIPVPVDKAPQNMCRVWVYENGKWVMYILISVRPEWLFLELKGEKNIEIRKKVLKEMLK